MMRITEEPVSWKDIKLKFKQHRYPEPLNKSLPRMYFVALYVASRGQGKTWAVVNLLKQYESCGILDTETNHKVDQRVILMSPTTDANPVFTSLKSLAPEDVFHDYSDDMLVDVINDIKREKEETTRYQERLQVYKKFLKCKSVDELTHKELIDLELNNFEPPKEPRFPHGVVNFLVLDDLIGSSAFKQTGKSALTNLILKNRHVGVNIMICTQNLKAIPKSIRTNTSLFCIFRFASKKIILDDLYTEVSNILTENEFEEVYEYATKDPHSFLCIDFSQPKDDRIKMGYNRLLRLVK